MLQNQRIIIVMPAYNAAGTLKETVDGLPEGVVDEIVLVDDNSTDNTVEIARQLGLHVVEHTRNTGYGGNQKTCYRTALEKNADIVIMVHPDYQYDPRLVTAMAGMIISGVYDAVFASRILGNGALTGGMPKYKYIANRLLTLIQNLLMGCKLSEYHTGYRGFSATLLRNLNLAANSDDFVFDNEMIAQCVAGNYRIGEISCPTKYFPEASSINFRRSCQYGVGVLRVALSYRLWKLGLLKPKIFSAKK